MDNAKRISEKFQEIKKSKHEFQKFQSCTLKFKNNHQINCNTALYPETDNQDRYCVCVWKRP